MGFFSDLKEDLSQAVNELLQEDETIKSNQESETIAETTDESTNESTNETTEVSLDDLLENIDSYMLPDEDALTEEKLSSKGTDVSENASALEDDDWFADSSESSKQEATVSVAEPEKSFLAETASEVEDSMAEDQVLNSMEAEMQQLLEQMLAGKNLSEAEEDETKESETKEIETPECEPQDMLQTESVIPEEEQEEKETELDTERVEEKMETRTERVAADETAVVTAGMTVTGDITSEGSMELVGTVNGNIDVWGKLNISGHVNGNSKAAEVFADGAKIYGEIESAGAVKVGASTVIIGNITAKSAAIAGAVKGDIDVMGPVVLDASAIVMGNIKSKSVQINNGAVIEGMCSQCYADVSPTSFFDDYK